VTHFNSIRELVEDVNFAGYYGGMRLIKGMIKVFYEYCTKNGIKIEERNFTIRYSSNIPLRLGLAGSSAIVTACLKALTLYFNIKIPEPVFANLVLSVERDELGISAGLQDRVAQAYETPVFMNFDRKIMAKQGYGHYEKISTENFPMFYIAYRRNLSEGTEVVHNNLKARFEIGDPEVLEAMQRWGQITEEFRIALNEGDIRRMNLLVNENFDLRRKIIRISKGNIEMVELARSVGASAKFTGSGGAVIGICDDDLMFNRLKNKLNANGIDVIKPNIVNKTTNLK
jgi:glucuronokinase